MRRTNTHIQIILSELARDPIVAAFFRRGEGFGPSPAVALPPEPTLPSGESLVMEGA